MKSIKETKMEIVKHAFCNVYDATDQRDLNIRVGGIDAKHEVMRTELLRKA
jgi:hypothetical protein